ncbi:SRPBCC family protein [Streptomyces bobili]|uniref:SRPBCC family protein n=1 Tax=Streptomyces bobili TaxID=67280 RepID=UPI0033A6BE8C
MTETLGSATSAAGGTAGKAAGKAAGGNPLAGVAQSEAADRLKAEVQEYLAAQTERVLAGVGRKLGETTVKLNDIAEGKSPGFAKLALDGGRKVAEGKGPVRTALELGASHAKDKVTGALKNLGGGKGKRKGGSGSKPTVIMEQIDVGVPLRTAYDQWTQYQDFSTFAKGVKSASRADDTTSDWQLKVFWSNRSWKAKTTEQLPDDRISWTSEGAKGTTKGVVSFHRIADSLTRVLLVIEYYPVGLFEKTGNIWRAQGRRARLDLKNFARFVTLKGEAEDGWRGEIRDGEVARSHEDALAAEESESEESGEAGEAGESGEEEYAEDEPEAGYDEEDEPEDEYEEADETEEEGEPEEEYEEADEDEDEPAYDEDRSRR